jgi:uncharacterized phage protein (TIGR02218 family)
MATFDTQEISRREGKPVFLFRFLVGTQSYTYTSADTSFEYLSETYLPVAGLKASGTGQSEEVHAQRITISAPRDWLIPSMYVAFVPAVRIYLSIFTFHRDVASDVHTFWQGFVRDAKWEGSQAKVECDPITVLLDRLGLRRTYQAMCTHVLYDGFCPVPASAFRVDGTLLSAPSAFTLNAAAWTTKPDGWFNAGFAERPLPSGIIDMRFITSHVGTQITLLSPFPPDLAGGEIIRAYAGCDHVFSTCAGKFGAYTDTGGAYGGWDRVPKKNLFKTGLNNAT